MSGADLISGVGCNATSAVFALLPLAKAGLIENARIECRVGSSEGGAEAKEGSSHSLRSRSLRVVSPFVHRHMAEVVQELGLAEKDISMTVMPSSLSGASRYRACDRKKGSGRPIYGNLTARNGQRNYLFRSPANFVICASRTRGS